MQLEDIRSFSADQKRGKWFEPADLDDGAGAGSRVKPADVYSATQNKVRLQLTGDLAALADADGRVTAAARETMRIDSLARCVMDVEILEDDGPVPFSHANIVGRLKAAASVQAQIDSFASNRAAFREAR